MRINLHKVQRQQLVTAFITEYQKSQQYSIQTASLDPFETYYYPSAIEDIQQLHKLQEKIKNKIIQKINIEKLQEIQNQIKSEEYFMDSKIRALEAENQEIQEMIKLAEQKIMIQSGRKSLKVQALTKEIDSWAVGCQTQEIKKKQIGTQCHIQSLQDQITKKQKIKSRLYVSPLFSLTIHQTKPQNEPQNLFPKAHPHSNTQKPKQPLHTKIRQAPLAPAKHPSHPQQPHQPQQRISSISNIYNELRKQMDYLRHLEKTKSKNRAVYEQQKKRVKFMIQIFWKNAGSQPGVQQMELPLLEEV